MRVSNEQQNDKGKVILLCHFPIKCRYCSLGSQLVQDKFYSNLSVLTLIRKV
jgi:hypothetical protein